MPSFIYNNLNLCKWEIKHCLIFHYSSLGVNLRLLVYRYGMKNSGDEASWTKMFDLYQKATLAQEKEKLLYGLASVENVSLLDQ